jgi:hypothetical protein
MAASFEERRNRMNPCRRVMHVTCQHARAREGLGEVWNWRKNLTAIRRPRNRFPCKANHRDCPSLTRDYESVGEVCLGEEVLEEGWWTAGGSNPRPLHCERSALPAELAARTLKDNMRFLIPANGPGGGWPRCILLGILHGTCQGKSHLPLQSHWAIGSAASVFLHAKPEAYRSLNRWR